MYFILLGVKNLFKQVISFQSGWSNPGRVMTDKAFYANQKQNPANPNF